MKLESVKVISNIFSINIEKLPLAFSISSFLSKILS